MVATARPRFVQLLAAAALGLLFLALSTPETGGAKGNVYVLTGGELGEYAYTYVEVELPGYGAQAISPPASLPSLRYDLFHSWGNLALPMQVARGGADHRYYPTARVVHYYDGRDGTADRWWLISEETARQLDEAIVEARAAMAAGTLERGPIGADFRARGLMDVTYTFVPLDGDRSDGGTLPRAATEEFVMRALADTASRPFAGTGLDGAKFEIQLRGSNIGGVLGFYSPPHDGPTGRFWHDGYRLDSRTPYWETTAEFDAMFARAQSGASESEDPQESANGGSDAGTSESWLIAVGSGASLLLLLGAALALRRRMAGSTVRACRER